MQQVIDGILYSPVNAHALRKGDLFALSDDTAPWRLLTNPERTGDHTLFLLTGIGNMGTEYGMEVMLNEPILRAVGAGVGGLL